MSAAAKTISEECSALAFYGIEPSAKAAESFYLTMIKWFTELGCPPDKVGVTGPGHNGKLASFTHGAAKLHKTGFEGVTVVEIVSTTPDARVWGRDYLLTASYDGRSDRLDVDVVARSSLATLSATSMLPLARILAQDLKPAYGIGYRREHRLGPELYGGGVCRGLGLTGAEREEAMNISFWNNGMENQVWREGVLRDIYPWNFLTAPQLNAKVGGSTLSDWIGQDVQRGTLSQISHDIVLWDVPESSIPTIRSRLQQASIILDWRRFG